MTTFTDTDLLDAMMRAAFKPGSEPFTTYDSNGNPQVSYQPTDALISPLVRVVQDKMEKDEVFRTMLTAALLERVDAIADLILTQPASLGIIKKNEGGYNRPVDYKLVEWLHGPLGEALAEQMAPAIREHLEDHGNIDIENANITIQVTVDPWPKKEAS